MTFYKAITIQLSLLFLAFCFSRFVEGKSCSGSATYKLSFQGEWEKTASRPDGAKFSGLIGCSHNHCYQMWKPNERASVGVKNLAENGKTTDLAMEILQHIRKKTALVTIKYEGSIAPEGNVILPYNGSATDGFSVDASHPYVSLVAKIHPSPDWFIGVQDFDLCNRTDGEWLKTKRETLYPYDAGTKSGIYFSSANDSTPRTYENIRHLTTGDLANEIRDVRGIGYFFFSLIKTFPRQSSGSDTVTDATFSCPNVAASLAKWSWCLSMATMIIIFG